MAELEKLAIRGIRSFSPEAEQTIEFYTPMTIILGQNGSGKTTIIECLKYACTGKLPGGSASSGQNWVHDPKLTNDSEVKACVKLRFKSRDGKRMLVSRSMQLQYKGKSKSATFKQVDGVVKSINPITRKAEHMAHKCTDLNLFVPMATGISAAILDSVVFCHQEDSSWPLQEGAVLKKRFDEIFESARYTKALIEIEKCRKVHFDEVKNLKIDLAGLNERREAAKGFRKELEAKKSEIEDLQSKLRSAGDRIAAMEERRRQAQKEHMDLTDMVTELDKKRALLEERQRALEDKRKSLGTEMKESDEDLEARLGSFSSDQKILQQKLDRLLQRESAAKKQMEQARAQRNRLMGEKGQLTAKIDQLMSAIQERNADIASLHDKYGLQCMPRALIGDSNKTAELPEAEVIRFTRALAAVKLAREEELAKFRTSKAEQLEQHRSTIAELTAKLLASEQSKAAKQDAKTEAEERQKALTHELNRQPLIPSTLLTDLDQELERVRKDFEALKKQEQERKYDEKINALAKELISLRADISTEDEVYRLLRSTEKERVDADKKAKDVKNAKEVLKSRCDKFNDAYETKLGGQVEATLQSLKTMEHSFRDIKMADHDEVLATVRAELGQDQQRVAVAENELKRVKSELQAVSNDVAEKSDWASKAHELVEEMVGIGMNKLNHDLEPDAVLELCDQELLKQSKKQYEKSTDGQAFAKLLELANKTGTRCCPACTRKMNDAELDTFHRAIDVQIEKSKQSAAKAKRNVDKVQQLRDDYRALLPSLRPLAQLKAKEQQLRQTIETFEKQAQEGRAAVAKAQDSVRQMEQEQKEYRDILSNLQNIVMEAQRLRDMEGELENLQQRLLGYSFNETRSIDQVEADIKHKRDELDAKTKAQSELQKEAVNNQRRLNQAQQRVTDTENRKRQKLNEIQKTKDLEAELDGLKERITQLTQDIKQAADAEMPIKNDRTQAEQELKRLQTALQAQESQLQSAHLDVVQRHNTFEQKQKRVREMESEKYRFKLARLEEDDSKYSKDFADAESQVAELAPLIGAALKERQDTDRIKKEVEENIAYRQLKHDLEQHRKELLKLKQQIDNKPDTAQLLHSLQVADKQWRESREEKAGIEAKLETLNKLKREQEGKLRSETYKDVEKKYKTAYIKCKSTEMAVQDLAQYHKALDRALMQYHSMKVEEINKIIRELWTRTYRGNDIEDISIVSGEDAAGGGGRAAKSYNYRVVMKKGGTMLDMRNRCSAGQRVLASIVIRLALAETFCINCGVMTLDEPTTNLDHENKDGLAQALARLICERGGRQRNFQLIIITHDEEFVHMMKTALSTMPNAPSMPEHYWRISRQEAGASGRTYSIIEQVEWGLF